MGGMKFGGGSHRLFNQFSPQSLDLVGGFSALAINLVKREIGSPNQIPQSLNDIR
jgi:hypothetical protein